MLERLTLKSKYADVVFLVQNLFSFDRLFSQRISDERYRHVLSLLFDAEIYTTLRAINPRSNQTKMTIFFRAPAITLNPIMSEKTHSVRCMVMQLVRYVYYPPLKRRSYMPRSNRMTLTAFGPPPGQTAAPSSVQNRFC
jgi:hypothetical protein